MSRVLGAAIALGMLFGMSGQSLAKTSAQKTACAQLKSAVANHEHRRDDLYCIPYQDTPRYLLFQLHEKIDPASVTSDWVGSDLVGYYAVSKHGFAYVSGTSRTSNQVGVLLESVLRDES